MYITIKPHYIFVNKPQTINYYFNKSSVTAWTRYCVSMVFHDGVQLIFPWKTVSDEMISLLHILSLASYHSDYHYCTTSFNKANNSSNWNKVTWFWLINHTTETIHHHYQLIKAKTEDSKHAERNEANINSSKYKKIGHNFSAYLQKEIKVSHYFP